MVRYTKICPGQGPLSGQPVVFSSVMFSFVQNTTCTALWPWWAYKQIWECSLAQSSEYMRLYRVKLFGPDARSLLALYAHRQRCTADCIMVISVSPYDIPIPISITTTFISEHTIKAQELTVCGKTIPQYVATPVSWHIHQLHTVVGYVCAQRSNTP